MNINLFIFLKFYLFYFLPSRLFNIEIRDDNISRFFVCIATAFFFFSFFSFLFFKVSFNLLFFSVNK